MKALKTFSYLLLFVGAVLSNSCLRFTPTRESLGGTDKAADEKAFHSLEQMQKARLASLIASRKSAQPVNISSTYKIGPGDVLQFSVFEVPELTNASTRVQPDGTISLPLIGSVTASGFTESELQAEVAKRLSKFIRQPQVTLFISEYEANKVSVIGAVSKPGRYPIKRSDYSLIDILSEAGGRTDKSSGTVILIPAQEQQGSPEPSIVNLTKSQGFEIYFEDLVGGSSRVPIFVPLLPGDTVVVPDAGVVQVDGEVKAPGSYPLASKTTLLGAIASAGGLTYSARVDSIEVIREVEAGKKAAITVDLEKLSIAEGKDVRLRDGDIVRVPSSSGRFVTRQIIEGINKVVGFGVSANP